MLKNENYTSKEVATSYGNIWFNEKGEAEGLTKEQEKSIAKLPGFEYVDNTPKKETKQEPKQDTKKESKTASEPKKGTKKVESKEVKKK